MGFLFNKNSMNTNDQTVRGYIRLACSDDGPQLFQLRLQSYQKAPEFDLVEPDSLRWSRSDENAIVLAAFSDAHKIIASTSANILTDSVSARESMECAWQECGDHLFPSILLGKGATAKEFQSSGLHSIIRYHLIKSSKKLPINSFLGIVFENAPRTNLMRAIGYNFFPVENYWFTDLRPKRQVLVAVLPRAKFNFAIKHLTASLVNPLRNFVLDEDLLKERLRDCLQSLTSSRII